MVVKQINKDTERFEWLKSKRTAVGELPNTTYEFRNMFNGIFRRLVSCAEYAKVYGSMKGKTCSANTIYKKAVRGELNRFMISGVSYILMTDEEYYVYLELSAESRKEQNDADRRKMLMEQPKNRFESELIGTERYNAETEYRDGKLTGMEWDTFFTDIFPKWIDKFDADSIGEWLAGTGYHADPDSDKGIVKRERHRVGEMWAEYKKWCRGNGYVAKYVKEFSIYIAGLGFQKSYSGGRNFDVFVMGNDEMDEMAIQMVLDKNAEIIARQEKEAERLMELQEKRRAKMEERLLHEPDEVWLEGQRDGRYVAATMYAGYSAWCRERMQQAKGKRTFYGWLTENSWRRETVVGTLWMEKKNPRTK